MTRLLNFLFLFLSFGLLFGCGGEDIFDPQENPEDLEVGQINWPFQPGFCVHVEGLTVTFSEPSGGSGDFSYRSIITNFDTEENITSDWFQQTSINLSSLEKGTRYILVIEARDDVTEETVLYDEVRFYTRPEQTADETIIAPQMLTPINAQNEVIGSQLVWSHPSNDASYTIIINGEQVEAGVSETSYAHNIPSGQSFTFEIIAFVNGNSASIGSYWSAVVE